MKSPRSVLADAVAAVVVGLGASADTVRTGFNVPLAGVAAADGRSALEGARLAVDQVNEAGGIGGEPFELLVRDDQANPEAARLVAVKMITEDGVAAGISGSYSGATMAGAFST